MSMSLKTIPLCQLQRSKINVRKTDKTADIEQLAASIEAHGLLENLVVSPLGSSRGVAPMYDVVAGSRRHAALTLLVKRRKIEKDFPVPCQVRKPNGGNPLELSLAENVERAPLHPADQFEAFAKLHADGLSTDDIALRFGLTPSLVAQRLRLAAVSPRLVAEYRKGEMTLEQLIAFTLSDDPALQEEAWFGLGYYDMPAHEIRRFLTQSKVGAGDRRARFVGAKAYEDAGGIILRDLFDEADEGYFEDSRLLDRLAAEKLEQEAVSVRSEGWKWVAVALDPETLRTARFARARTIEATLSKKEEKRFAKLAERYDALIAELEDNEDETPEGLERVSQELAALQAKKEVWPEAEKARAGVLIALNADGAVVIDRGLVRPEDQPSQERESANAPAVKVRGPYPESLLLDLSAHRTAALREVLAGQPGHALTALLVCLADSVILDGLSQGCIGIGTHVADLERASKSVAQSKAVMAFLERHTQWQERLAGGEDLWERIASLDASQRMSLLAHCVSATVTALRQRGDTVTGRRRPIVSRSGSTSTWPIGGVRRSRIASARSPRSKSSRP